MGVVGLDVGGTSIKGGVVGPACAPLKYRTATGREAGHEAVVETVLATVDSLLGAAATEGWEVEAVGLAALGIVDEVEGIARRSAAIGWQDVPLRDLVAERAHVPVVLGHDVRAAAVAEAALGAGRGHRNVLFLPVGTGLSVAQVVDGHALPGATWQAGEIGQLLVTAGDGASDGSRGRLPLEGIASAQGLARGYVRRGGQPLETADAKAIFEAVGRGDAVASQVLDEALRLLAEVLAVVITFADPAIVIVGGGLSLAGEALLEPLRTRVEAALGWREPPPLVAAQLGDEAGWIGAALLAWRLAGHPESRFLAGVWQ